MKNNEQKLKKKTIKEEEEEVNGGKEEKAKNGRKWKKGHFLFTSFFLLENGMAKTS